MQVIYGDASNITLTAQKRLIRVVYGQTQVTPYAGVLDATLRGSEGEIVVPKSTDTKPIKRSATAFTFQGSIVPGTVLVKTEGEALAVAAGAKGERPFGLLGQWVGGTFDNLKQTNQIAAWLGPDALLDILKPGFNEKATVPGGKKTITEVLTIAKEALETPAKEKVAVVVGDSNGLLSPCTELEAKEAELTPVGEIIDYSNTNVLRIKLRV